MQTKEELLEVIKAQRCSQLETIFNNMIGSGLKVTYGNDRTEEMMVAGGREALFSLKAFLSYYKKINASECIIRDPYTKEIHSDTIENMEEMISEVEDWGMESYIKNIRKQDYIKKCESIEDVMNVTWDSIED